MRMGTTLSPTVPATRERLRRWLLIPATAVLIFGPLHHLDHSIRGNHVGWPLIEAATPFTFSLLVYPFLLLGLYLTAQGRAWAGYWLAFAIPTLALVLSVHFLPTEGYEPLSDIYLPYADPIAYSQTAAAAHRAAFFRDVYPPYASPLWGILAVADVLALIVSLVLLIVAAVRVRRLSGHW